MRRMSGANIGLGLARRWIEAASARIVRQFGHITDGNLTTTRRWLGSNLCLHQDRLSEQSLSHTAALRCQRAG
jgi:hypothetical protein